MSTIATDRRPDRLLPSAGCWAGTPSATQCSQSAIVNAICPGRACRAGNPCIGQGQPIVM
eukprot:921851-Heterocapsa_arctica.AAC.1